ncbi:hypothetical protein DFH11DRAFT_1543901 [Phellopilus nigrolimitatus]|nr:hypothetical protein DFH11DRAFT_1543901 [Phellopilus nigrolimitatus]
MADGRQASNVCATHFLGDGMVLHRIANELFLLLVGRDPAGGGDALERVRGEHRPSSRAEPFHAPRGGRRTPAKYHDNAAYKCRGICRRRLQLSRRVARPPRCGRASSSCTPRRRETTQLGAWASRRPQTPAPFEINRSLWTRAIAVCASPSSPKKRI